MAAFGGYYDKVTGAEKFSTATGSFPNNGKKMDQCRGNILGGGKQFLEKSNQHDPNKNLGAKKLTPKTQLFHFRFEIIVPKTNSSYLTGSLSQKESLPSPNFSGALTASFQIER